jgi:integrase
VAGAGREQKFRVELASWLAQLRKDGHAATANTYAKPIEGFLDLTRGNLTRGSIGGYLDNLDEQGLGPATRAKNISAVRTFLIHCMEETRPALIPWCPIDALGLKRPKRIKSDPGRRTMLTSELEAVYAASRRIGEREHALVWLLATTGLRVSEVCKARWSDLRLDEVTGRVALHIESLKRGEDRNVEVVPGLFQLLAQLHGSDKLSNRDGRPLIAHAGGHYTRSGVHRLLTRVLTEAGIDRDHRNISALWFRHSTFSLEGRNLATAYQIRKQAGHQRIETSQHYVDLGRGLLDSPTHLLPQFLLGEGYTKPQTT